MDGIITGATKLCDKLQCCWVAPRDSTWRKSGFCVAIATSRSSEWIIRTDCHWKIPFRKSLPWQQTAKRYDGAVAIAGHHLEVHFSPSSLGQQIAKRCSAPRLSLADISALQSSAYRNTEKHTKGSRQKWPVIYDCKSFSAQSSGSVTMVVKWHSRVKGIPPPPRSRADNRKCRIQKKT